MNKSLSGSAVHFVNIYLLDSYLIIGWHYTPFEQLGAGVNYQAYGIMFINGTQKSINAELEILIFIQLAENNDLSQWH